MNKIKKYIRDNPERSKAYVRALAVLVVVAWLVLLWCVPKAAVLGLMLLILATLVAVAFWSVILPIIELVFEEIDRSIDEWSGGEDDAN